MQQLQVDLFWVNKKQYSCSGMFSNGRNIAYGRVKNREYFKFSDVEKIFRQGSLVYGWKKGVTIAGI